MMSHRPRLPFEPRFASLARVRAHVKSIAAVSAVLVAISVALLAGVAGGVRSDAHAAPTTPASSIPALGKQWFALGANQPWLRYGCDFGCGMAGGVRGNRAAVDATLRTMSRRGVRVVRWYLFPRDAAPVQRTADGTPSAVAPGALLDLDVAAQLAAKHDVFLLPVVLPEPAQAPTTWLTDAAQQAALVAALRPMFARYASQPHVLGWEVGTGADALVDAGTITRDQARSQALALIGAIHAAAPGRLAFVGPADVSRIDGWVGLGADAYLPQDASSFTGDRSASAHSVASLAETEGADAPVVIGGFDVASDAIAAQRLETYRAHGYAGALAWSWRDQAHPANPTVPAPMPDDAFWRFHYAHPASGPRSRPLNPCYGPDKGLFLCPNLRMAKPSHVSLGHVGHRSILYSANSLDSRGTGPASIRGVRNGKYTMAAKQLLHRRDGRVIGIATGAKLYFKPVPGQYRYWKWNGAARMELWRLDSTGKPVLRVQQGPKTIYCLRDLKHTAPRLAHSPHGRVFPGCSQRLSQQSVTLGTSVGWSDVYPATYHENWIDVTGLRGCFAYVHVADPTNVIYESNEDDNASFVVVKLPYTGSNAGCPGAKPIPTTDQGGVY
jgi:hypothetical protein